MMQSSKKIGLRTFFGSSNAMPAIDLTSAFPGVPIGTPETHTGVLESKTAPSGLRLVTDSTDGNIITLGLSVNAGTRYEKEKTVGLTNLMSQMAFRSTETRSDLRMYRDIEALGGRMTSCFGRDYIQWSISVLPCFVNEAASLLAEAVSAPRFAKWDIKQQMQMAYDVSAKALEDPTSRVIDGIHAAAYYDTVGLGRSLYDTFDLAKLSKEDVENHFQTYFTAENSVLVGTGIDMAGLEGYANSMALGSNVVPTPPTSTYYGGEFRTRLAINETHMALGFDGVSVGDEAMPAAVVLTQLLSNKLKESKGSAFNHVYESNGLMGVMASCAPGDAPVCLETLIKTMTDMASKTLSDKDITGAKMETSLKFASDMEKRDMRFHTIGKLALNGRTDSTASVVESLNNVSAAQVSEVAKKLLTSKPSFAAVGDLSHVPRYHTLLGLF